MRGFIFRSMNVKQHPVCEPFMEKIKYSTAWNLKENRRLMNCTFHAEENNKSYNMLFKTKPRSLGHVSDRLFEMIYTPSYWTSVCDCVKFIAREIMIKMRQKRPPAVNQYFSRSVRNSFLDYQNIVTKIIYTAITTMSNPIILSIYVASVNDTISVVTGQINWNLHIILIFIISFKQCYLSPKPTRNGYVLFSVYIHIYIYRLCVYIFFNLSRSNLGETTFINRLWLWCFCKPTHCLELHSINDSVLSNNK